MNRPEPIELENNLGPDAVTGEINRVPWMAYDVDEMDIYIAEKDKEIAELKQKLEDVQASHYAEMVDAGMRERRLRRAVYKACANWACAKMEYAQFDSNMFMCGFITDKEVSWESMMKKCLKKAEEYR